MLHFFKSLFLTFIIVVTLAFAIFIYHGSAVELNRPYDEDAYGWYEYQISVADDRLTALDIAMGLDYAFMCGNITQSEYDVLHDLAVSRSDSLCH